MIGAAAEAAGAAAVPGAASLSFSGRAMASPLTLTIAQRSPGNEDDLRGAEVAWAAVVDEFARCEDAMSRFRDDSEITRLNRLAGWASLAVGGRLVHALVASDRARRLTGGRFDPRVINALERIGYEGAVVPLTAVVQTDRVVDLDRRAGMVRLPAPVDLGGIGKGLALRWAARRVEEALPGFGFLLDAGGDLVGRPPAGDGPTWRIGIEDPRLPPGEEGPPLAVAELSRGAVATSSVRRNRWRSGDGRDVHHLIDPRTNEPAPTDLFAVTVAHADPAWAEVWAKALFIEGLATIGPDARARGLAAWWVEADGTLAMTPAARERTIWSG